MLDACKDGDLPIMEFDGSIKQLGNRLLSANAYLGAEPMAQALSGGADIVITGRASDPALFLAPMIHAFGWAMDDWNLLGQGTVAGHLLECAGQITGGYFADPGYKDVPDLARLGFPIGEVGEDGALVITKVAGSGGAVTAQTCKEQLLYEVHDPKRYIQPDVVADFSQVKVEEIAADRVRVSGGRGTQRTDTLKVSVGYVDSFIGEGQISYAGPGALARGRLALEIVRERLKLTGVAASELRFELIGVDSLHGAGSLRSARMSPTRCAFASPAVPKACARRCGSATRSKRSTPTAPPPAAARSNRRATWSRSRRSCCRANLRSRRSVSWGRE